jgi:putative DNA primase/helicase
VRAPFKPNAEGFGRNCKVSHRGDETLYEDTSMKKKALRPKLRLLAIAEDKATSEFFAVIKFRDQHGKMRRRNLPLEELNNVKALVNTLTKYGAYFPDDQQTNKRALQKLISARHDVNRITFAAQVGWYRGYSTFVLPNHVIGTSTSDLPIRPPRLNSSTHAGETRGDHAEWLRTVACPAKFSSRMVLAISAALAAPLLRMAKLPSFGILVHGRGKAGKSTMLLAAASIIGYRREQDLPNFRATDTALGEIPAAFNDSLMPLNELGLLKGSATQKYLRLRDFTYGSAEGRGTTYSKLAPIAEASVGLEWLCIFFATGEEASNEIARDARETRMAGESIRWIDLAGTRNGALDIFDRIPKDVAESDRAEWAEKTCATIRNGCLRNHGFTLQQFIKQIIINRKVVQKQLKSLRKKFVSRVTDANDDPVVRHLAKCCGHIYAAALIAVRFGILTWSKKTVRVCIERCYRDARRELNTETDLLREGLSIMHAKIRALPKANDADLKSADGFLKGTNPNQATIRAEAFKHWFPDVRQPNIVLNFLRAKNALPSRPTPKSGIAIVWAESQPLWPDGTRPRSIIIEERPGQLKM